MLFLHATMISLWRGHLQLLNGVNSYPILSYNTIANAVVTDQQFNQDFLFPLMSSAVLHHNYVKWWCDDAVDETSKR